MNHPPQSSKSACGMAERDETPAYEARNHSKRFLEKAARMAGKKPSKRSAKKRG